MDLLKVVSFLASVTVLIRFGKDVLKTIWGWLVQGYNSLKNIKRYGWFIRIEIACKAYIRKDKLKLRNYQEKYYLNNVGRFSEKVQVIVNKKIGKSNEKNKKFSESAKTQFAKTSESLKNNSK